MEPHFERVTIIGAGLLGASLGLALKARGLADYIVGVGRRPASLDAALRVGAVDSVSMDARAAAEGAELIVICTPAALVERQLDEVRPVCSAQAVVTDVASTKQAVCGHAARTWPSPRRFVGSHPMAGSEKFGPEHGRADLYENSVCLVESGAGLDEEARQRVAALWTAVGATVFEIDPARHDALLARTSHIPHVLAAGIATLAARHGDVRRMIGQGYRDMTRIAASRPEVWRDICLTNRNAMLDGIREFQEYLAAFARAIEEGDAGALDALFSEANRARRATVDE